MSKKNKKQYTFEQKYAYHKRRRDDKSATENQRIYSCSWLYGFTNRYISEDLPAAERDLKLNKESYGEDILASCYGEIAGSKAALKASKNLVSKARNERYKHFPSSRDFEDKRHNMPWTKK